MSSAVVLPQDLILEILSWLPVKTLMRFRCVSKTWNFLIFNPIFVKLHLQRCPRNTDILISFDTNGIIMTLEDMHTLVSPCPIHHILQNPSSTIDDCAQQTNGDYFVFGVCKGLVGMFSSTYSFGFDKFEDYWVRFWNPATRIVSEDSPHFYLNSTNYKIGRYDVKFGFGCDDWNDTCKVVVVLLDIKSQQMEIRVHCLGNTTWRKTLTCPAFPVLGLCGQFVNGTMNWLALHLSTSNYQWKTVTINQLLIFSYDLKNETSNYLFIPDGLTEIPTDEPNLGTLKGCLCLSYEYRKTHFVLWIMREFGDEKSWTQLLNVSYEHLQIANPIFWCLCASLCAYLKMKMSYCLLAMED